MLQKKFSPQKHLLLQYSEYSETSLSCIMYTSILYMYQVFTFPI